MQLAVQLSLVELDQDLSGLHMVAGLGAHLYDATTDLRLDFGKDHRDDLAGDFDRVRDVVGLNPGRAYRRQRRRRGILP